MTGVQHEIEFLAPGEQVDLTNCEREPIHVPGSIQPRGVLIAVRDPDWVVQQVSENLADLTGVDWRQALGRPLAEVIGAAPARAVISSASAFGDLRERNPVEIILDVAGEPVPVDALLHRTVIDPGPVHGVDGEPVAAPEESVPVSTLVVELEPARGPRPFSFPNTYQAVRSTVAALDRAGSLQELYDITAAAVRTLTGFDRVMVYRYDADYNGEVVAEAKAAHLNSFLGLHYPASDIPAQARALYEKNWIRLISDVGYAPVPIQPVHHPASGRPLDLTYSALRSVSPIHVEYLHNMGVRSSMSISLLRGDKLWGLIACHHYDGPHAPPYATRAAAEFLGSTLSVRLIDRAQEEEFARALSARSTLAWLTAAALDEERPITETLLGSPSLLDLLAADGVSMCLQGTRGSAGAALPPELADAIAAWAASRGEDVVATDALAAAAPGLGAVDPACGVLVLPLPEGQYVLWSRGEAVRHIDWGGDPHNKAIAEREGDAVRLSPRKSFERWRETVRGRSESWSAQETAEAAELRVHLLEALYARSRSIVRAAETLQRSLLTDPPEPDHLEVAVRYVPAAREAQVGGDWYDVFEQPDGSTVLVIGDVVGHDTQAAATMSQLRGLLRGIAWDSVAGPAEVLSRIDAAIEGLGLGAMATVLVGRLDRPAGPAGDGTRLRWASAGHLPPLLVAPDGSQRLLVPDRPGLLLGVDPSLPRTEHEAVVVDGSTLLLYTDGLVERRDQVFDDGVDLLGRALAELRHLPVARMSDALIGRLLPEGGEDDVALVAVRLRAAGG
ncbi:GAF domain-containing protein [Blastococcus sp. MG754426]|uniref:SpoIIE family protein phosphatase n=1 Tax=unclassified Blastococcus TaxID=2619396 RepID=UPI001EEF9E31|nr:MULTISPECIES: SpoIIE family protein phosphatase [unclassified Blastococcus]MCF6506895.1 GAF domain-containing protein [Blastococcus sp. MG754426]MCF6511859.1 GAF domain-containing protein [Blastococcus sp. MG754427]MCF6736786.1 GAF domain-containing protein [Blastococcus sp. KM273129]